MAMVFLLFCFVLIFFLFSSHTENTSLHSRLVHTTSLLLDVKKRHIPLPFVHVPPSPLYRLKAFSGVLGDLTALGTRTRDRASVQMCAKSGLRSALVLTGY
ncbi:hypothetical protein B0F90DRAFT_247018 [Multifurca ochricompacta]|uniref:Secreted protein n=1 Tax=Multifurca ochricompacta TaxID=376703 RepID=A0AAD4M6X1_9AGAM|nr:hypothetical protein B0F90DRAFT_247018 [Multifurca ochricompacta]